MAHSDPKSAPAPVDDLDEAEALPFRFHPRTFKALGADLVTNDVVAIIELVKNAYDAYASEVEIRFREEDGIQLLEIEDDGSGMDRTVLEAAWSTVATPYRHENPVAKRPGRSNRRVSGNKGLGRLSAARLGERLTMMTQTSGGECWQIDVDWAKLAESPTLEACAATIRRCSRKRFKRSGTLIRIAPLRSTWDDTRYEDLRDNLARLLPPFATNDGFAIRLSRPGLFDVPIDVEPPPFLLHPKYAIRGKVDGFGKVSYRYEYNAVKGDGQRRASGAVRWNQIREASDDNIVRDMEQPKFGPFEFEIRAWDIAPNDTQEIAERFDLRKASIRKDIRAYKGISVYRDGVLVLPKSEGARDWLGLDLRRVGRVGPRLSTTQLVGYVEISATKNPHLEDTSDRERLASTPEVIAFEETLRAIVATMENEREKDRREVAHEKRVVELFQRLSAKELIAGVSEVAKEGGPASEALPLVEDFGHQLEQARQEIENRFVYYSRLASVGTIAHYLVHEVRQRTTVLERALEVIMERLQSLPDEAPLLTRAEVGLAAVKALDTLADKFAPLANRQFRRRMRTACIEESVLTCLLALEGDLKKYGIKVNTPRESATPVSIDPGELEIILLNLLSNAVYWVAQNESSDRRIEIHTNRLPGGKRLQVGVHDSGPGVAASDVERIFWPGVTNKPGGIGMGLTVASELVAEYGGRLGLDRKGRLGGASFMFDVPLP